MFLNPVFRFIDYFFLTFLLGSMLFVGACGSPGAPAKSKDDFFMRRDSAHNGDYLATYPLHNPDSCIIRLKAEVPPEFQPWACLSLWYRLPRTSPPQSFHFLDLYEQHYPHDTVSAFTQVMRAEFYVEMNKMDSARQCLDVAERMYQKLNRYLDLSDVRLLRGRIYSYQNKFATALKYYFEALDLLNSRDTAFTERHSLLYYDIAIAYERSHRPPKEREWLKKAFYADDSKLDNPPRYKTRITRGLCFSYLESDPDSSLYWANVTKDIMVNQLKMPLPPRLNYIFGRAYVEKGAAAQALPYLQSAYRNNKEKREGFGYYQHPQALGHCFLRLHQLDSAEIYLKQALPTPDTGNLSALHVMLSNLYAQKGDYRAALAAEEEALRLFKIKYTQEQAIAVADMEARYEVAQKERQIEALEKQRQITRLWALISALSAALLFGTVLALYFRYRSRQRLLEQEKQLAKAQAELQRQQLLQTEADLASKSQALVETTQLLAFKNELIADLEMRLSEQVAIPSASMETPNFYQMKILTNDDWFKFQQAFEQRFPGFTQRVKALYPDLTNAEIRLFLLVKLGFESREIADMQGVSIDTIYRNRNRLRKKLGLSGTEDFDQFIRQIK